MMHRKFIFITILAILSSISISTFSQVVNIEEKRVKKENGIQGNAEFSYNFVKTSLTSKNLGNKVKLQYFSKRHTILLFNDLSWAKVDTNNYINSGFQHLRYNYTLTNKWLTLEAFAQHQYNKLTGIERRILGGFGPRFRISDKENFRLFTGPLAMYEYELQTDNTDDYFYRLSWYVSMNYKISKIASINLVNYYQPVFSEFNDFRISSECSILFHLNKYLKFKTSAQLNYDSEPPANIDKLNYSVLNSLVFAF